MPKRVIAAALACVVTVVLAGCGSVPSPSDEFGDEQFTDNTSASSPDTQDSSDDDEYAFDGQYRGEYVDVDDESNTGTVTFTITNGVITDFQADPLAICNTPKTLSGIEVAAVVIDIDKIEVSDTGSFHYSITEPVSDDGTAKQTTHVEGRVDDGAVNDGVIELTQVCEVTANFTAETL